MHSIPVFTIPYGILSIIGYVKKYSKTEVSFDILDLNLEVYKLLKNNLEVDNLELILENTIKNTKYDIIGISALFNNAYTYLKNFSKLIQNIENSPLCVLGGGLASNLYKDIMDNFDYIDAICLAEGEKPFLDLIDSLDMKNLLNNHQSWITKEKIDNNFIFRPTYIENLDEIPILEYDLIEIDYYNGRSVDKRFADGHNKREFSIHTSRGCPYNCIYCSNTSIHGKAVRVMSIQRIVDEIDFLIENYNMNVLLIEDDHFLANTQRAIDVLNALATKNIRIEFPNGISVRGINEELGIALKNAGVSAVNLAVESGSNFVLKKIIRKPHLDKHIKPAVEILRKNDIRVHAFIVIGLPNELKEHREETKQMLKDVGFDWVYIFLAVPIAGSKLYDICIENDYLVEKDFSKHIVSSATIKAPGVDPESIKDEMYLMNLDVNFINNWNVDNHRSDIALPYFESIVKKYQKHAFGYYVLYKIYKNLNYDIDKIEKVRNKFNSLINASEEWKNYSQIFNIKI